MGDERGSVLLLMPAAVLVVVLLASVAVDRAVTFGAQRELVSTAQAAANDAAALGVDLDEVRDGSGVTYDRTRIDRAVRAAIGVDAGPGATEVDLTWEIHGNILTVRLAREVRLVFSPGVLGGRRSVQVTATASAQLAVDGTGVPG